jgi:KUP system potassium uptake protein
VVYGDIGTSPLYAVRESFNGGWITLVVAVAITTVFTKTSFYIGRETLLTSGSSRMMRWRKAIFAFMSRNAANPTVYFGIPPNQVVELGAQIRF